MIQELRGRLKAIRKSVKGNWRVLIDIIGLQKKVSDEDTMAKLLNQAFVISGRQGYTRLDTTDLKELSRTTNDEDRNAAIEMFRTNPKMVKGYPLHIFENKFGEKQIQTVLKITNLAQFREQLD
eukprot:CAMPEP_0176475228 /NCGR_PEP_ID=MMETSP0127-20121128/43490_1 /TAXON_ID=938130 /ORGANISM="Platyophrya macrostoma, Strain WH" /LENGTH=123 /DNA_ID=CAMNT_0017870801 /DNA_START=195 /DNA_END=563 /DNA_ORIENTATION=-